MFESKQFIKGKDAPRNFSFRVFPEIQSIQSISWNTNLTLISLCLNIKFQLNYFSKLSWNISMKEIFSFQKLKISFSKILF